MSTLKKPHPDAIQTVYGWALPATGEVLVSKRGLPEPVAGFKIGKPWKNEIPIVTVLAVPDPVVKSAPVEVIPEPVIEPPVIESFEEMVAEVPIIKPKRVIRKKPVINTAEDNLK